MKRGCLIFLSFLLLAGSVQAEKAPSGPALDDIFLWLAGGLPSARVQRMAGAGLACRITPSLTRALQKSGASPALIQDLARQSTTHQNANYRNASYQKVAAQSERKKSAPTASCTCGSGAVAVATFVHDKNLQAAEDKVQAMLRDDSGNASLLFVLGTILRRQERFDEALDAFTQSLHLMPGFAETHSQLSYLYYRTDDADYALAEARTALSIDPGNAEAYRYLGLALYANGHYDAALNAFQKSLGSEPENADVYFDMGITQRDKGDLRRAVIAYHHALSLRPDFWQAHSNLGVVLRDQGKLDEALAEYRIAVRLKPDEPSVRNNLGNTLCDKEDFDDAIAEFKELYRQTPEWEGGHNCLARAYMSKADYPAAILELHMAIVANPAGAAEQRALGQALLLIRKGSGSDRGAPQGALAQSGIGADPPLSGNCAGKYPAIRRCRKGVPRGPSPGTQRPESLFPGRLPDGFKPLRGSLG